MVVRVMALCVAAAMLCSTLRVHRPEMAMALSLAAAAVALSMLGAEISRHSGQIEALKGLLFSEDGISGTVLRAAGIAVLSELCGQLCQDAGERAMAGRIALASRVAMLGLCLPMLIEIVDGLPV